MKFFKDGDQLCMTRDDFINLHESPVVFLPLDGEIAKTILRTGKIISISLGDLIQINYQLEEQAREIERLS